MQTVTTDLQHALQLAIVMNSPLLSHEPFQHHGVAAAMDKICKHSYCHPCTNQVHPLLQDATQACMLGSVALLCTPAGLSPQ